MYLTPIISLIPETQLSIKLIYLFTRKTVFVNIGEVQFHIALLRNVIAISTFIASDGTGFIVSLCLQEEN